MRWGPGVGGVNGAHFFVIGICFAIESYRVGGGGGIHRSLRFQQDGRW